MMITHKIVDVECNTMIGSVEDKLFVTLTLLIDNIDSGYQQKPLWESMTSSIEHLTKQERINFAIKDLKRYIKYLEKECV